jgi:hypothetical protein
MERLPHRRPLILIIARACLLACAAAALPVAAQAGDGAGARRGVQAKPGEIVLLRNAAARPADRAPVSPGVALIVNPSPRGQVDAALGLGGDEISDADFASLSATPRAPQTHGGGTVNRAIDGALAGSMGGTSRPGGDVSGNGVSNVVGGPMGAVGNATRGIGSQVTGALSQLPLSGLPAGGGH